MRTLLRDICWNKKFIQFLLIGLIIILVGWLGKDTFITGFTWEQQRTLLLLGIAMFLWIAAPIPTGASSILILALLLISGVVDSMDEAVVGFLSPALYFILMLSIISHVLVKIGIDKIIARFLIKVSKGGPAFIIVGLPIFILVLPILLPSAVARFKMLLPLISRLNRYYGFGEKSTFKKYCLYVIGMMNQNATMIIYTGGGFPILASQLIRDYNIAELGWLDWFFIMAPPLWVGSFITVFFVMKYLKHSALVSDNVQRKSNSVETSEGEDTISSKFWIVLLSFFAMIFVWIITDQQHVPLLIPPMLLVVFYSIPKLGLVTNKEIRNLDWENFLLLGASFSLGMIMEANGTAAAIASKLIGIIPEDAGMIMKVIIIALIVFVIRFFFIVPSSAVIVIFPIVMSYSELIGLPPIQLAFLIIMIIGSMMILPIHSTTTYLAYDTGVFTKMAQYVIGTFTSILFLIIAIIAALFYW